MMRLEATQLNFEIDIRSRLGAIARREATKPSAIRSIKPDCLASRRTKLLVA
jgi:hypothetical protein